MVRYVKRKYIIDLINQSYINQEENCNFCFKSNCLFCKRSTELEKQLRHRGFNTRYSKPKKRFIIYYQNHQITVFPVSK